MNIDGNAPAIIPDRDRAINVDGNIYFRAETGEMFVDRVVEHLKHHVVQTTFIRIADVHAGSFSNSFKAFEFIDLRSVIFLRRIDAGYSIRRRKFRRQFVIGFRHRRWSRDHRVETYSKMMV